ncbi:hypothetical protein EFK50_18605 [Nocardioides marmoriginsengisoli]|uniref:DUF5808 domain-containing protein n=1 Tax=Nocardioides marmoriginsengisoli TaxID=661483 RepID=A0A3N0CEC7_9ACTN|nr:DUF5808 domain-containing protein [Nocardioides marmoriginsengisoli]RNL61363.1 hypothetical protein EFK50_18605 [Nocardioides marmoriginsengisoli]
MADGKRSRTGTFWGIPYDWRRPTRARFKERMWNPEDPRFMTPRAFGWGYDLNFYRLFHRRSK